MATEAVEHRASAVERPAAPRLGIKRYFTNPGTHPYDEVAWERRSAGITGEGGQSFFEQNDIEVPKAWSQLATNVVASKYFRGALGSPQREHSVRQIIDRVVLTIRKWGEEEGYFSDANEADSFEAELMHLLVNQKVAFNSPVWFNVGTREEPQCSACFILSVDDTMDSILAWISKEGRIFKGGSGSGLNLSNLRSSKELLSGGGTASGPVSFMRGADACAGAIKSGGTTRRAAKMVVLNCDHPDIVEFVNCKAQEEKKAWALGEMGYDMGMNGEAWQSIQFQNANNSVRVTDEFMYAAEANGDWHLKAVTTGESLETMKARDLLRDIAEAAWVCGDPGMQYDTTINRWHTCPNSGRINASNPCSEYMHIDDSACNLASLNLMKYVGEQGEFLVDDFRQAIDVTTTAMDIIVARSGYPTEEIGKNARAFRQLGLGYANLGALIMSKGLPYDGDTGRAYAAAITALMTGRAYEQSTRLAERMGPFEGYEKNAQPMQGVLRMHQRAVEDVRGDLVADDTLLEAARTAWATTVDRANVHGVRNAQASVLAPTGTIGFMMDCDTTGVEPDIALVKYKKLVGGGVMKIVNNTVPSALAKLGYDQSEIDAIVSFIDEHETIEGAPGLKDEHLPVFDCAFTPMNGTRSIHYRGHILMMGAVQPFISGAISKTVNMPNEATPEEIMAAYLLAWKSGVKALAIYRDGSKRTQPLSTGKSEAPAQLAAATAAHPARRRMPDTREAITHHFSIAGHDGYITAGKYEDGSPGEVFIKMAKQGSTVAGLVDSLAICVSMALQHGVPLEILVDKLSHTRFEPAGFTPNPEIPMAKSIVDYVVRWLGSKFLTEEQKREVGILTPGARAEAAGLTVVDDLSDDAPSAGAQIIELPVQAQSGQTSLELPVQAGGWRDLRQLRLDDDPLGHLLQVRELRQHLGLLVAPAFQE